MRAALAVLVLMACLVACGRTTTSTYPECIGAARYGDGTYREVGFTDHEGTTLNKIATYASCDTVDRHGLSQALREHSKPVKARSLPGYGPDEVIAVQVTDTTWSVLLSETAPDRLLSQIRASHLLDAGEQ